MLSLGEKRGLKGFVEIVGFVKVLEFVRVLFSKDSVLNEEKDDFSDVTAFGDPPILKDGGAHRSIFLKNVVAKSKEKFVATDVTFFVAGVLCEAVDGEVESLSDQKIGSRLEALFLLNDGGNGVLELVVLHLKISTSKKPAVFQPAGFWKFPYMGNSMKPSSFRIRVGCRIFRSALASI